MSADNDAKECDNKAEAEKLKEGNLIIENEFQHILRDIAKLNDNDISEVRKKERKKNFCFFFHSFI